MRAHMTPVIAQVSRSAVGAERLSPSPAARGGRFRITAPGHEQIVTGFGEAERTADALAEQLRLRARERRPGVSALAGVGGPPNPHATQARSWPRRHR